MGEKHHIFMNVRREKISEHLEGMFRLIAIFLILKCFNCGETVEKPGKEIETHLSHHPEITILIFWC